MAHPVSLRLSDELKTRTDRLLSVMRGDPAYAAFSLSLTRVALICLSEGLRVLEDRYAKQLRQLPKR